MWCSASIAQWPRMQPASSAGPAWPQAEAAARGRRQAESEPATSTSTMHEARPRRDSTRTPWQKRTAPGALEPVSWSALHRARVLVQYQAADSAILSQYPGLRLPRLVRVVNHVKDISGGPRGPLPGPTLSWLSRPHLPRSARLHRW